MQAVLEHVELRAHDQVIDLVVSWPRARIDQIEFPAQLGQPLFLRVNRTAAVIRYAGNEPRLAQCPCRKKNLC